jgi:GT2 family glycosyltransferase
MRLSIVVATYGREEVLVETVERLLALSPPPEELLVVDQTIEHGAEVERRLRAWRDAGSIGWLRRNRPSIPAAMNEGLVAAKGDLVLFVDDDVEPAPDLVAAHRSAHEESGAQVVAGQVLQPGEEPAALSGARFSYRSSLGQEALEFIGCNFSVERSFAVEIGGFDERFVGAAYRYEADFAARARAAGGRIWFAPRASLRHLRAPRGGTRAHGSHLETFRPVHSVGEYYHLLRNRPSGAALRVLTRPWRSVVTRHHLRRPWWIPVTLAAELAGLVWAAYLALAPRRLLTTDGRRVGAPP